MGREVGYFWAYFKDFLRKKSRKANGRNTFIFFVNIPLNKIFIANYSSDYYFTIKKIFSLYNIPIYLKGETTLSDTSIGKYFIDNLSNNINVLLNNIKKEYGHDRLTEIRDEITEIKIEPTKIIPKEDVIVVVTKEGYIKRVSLRSYNPNEETLLKENDYIIGKYQINTSETILLFTDLGNYLYIPVYEIPDLK